MLKKENVKDGELCIIQNVDPDIVPSAAVYADYLNLTAELWESMVVLTFLVPNILKLANLTHKVVLLEKNTTLGSATNLVVLDSME